MSTTRARIPGSIVPFNSYIEKTSDHMVKGNPVNNATRLGILEPELQSWISFRDEWLPLFPQYANKRNSRTLLITDQLHVIIRKTKAYDKKHRILDRIAASPNVTVTDLTTFHIKSGPLAKQSRTKPSKPISTLVAPEIVQIGGGKLSIRCNNNADSRTAIIADANEVEFRYLSGAEAPASANDPLLWQGVSTKARFTLGLGDENSGKTAYLYFRWANSRYPALAGPWSQLYAVLIL